MDEVDELSYEEKEFLRPFLPRSKSDDCTQNVAEGAFTTAWESKQVAGKPFVTLTYASSLDSMISLGPGVRTALSGPKT